MCYSSPCTKVFHILRKLCGDILTLVAMLSGQYHGHHLISQLLSLRFSYLLSFHMQDLAIGPGPLPIYHEPRNLAPEVQVEDFLDQDYALPAGSQE